MVLNQMRDQVISSLRQTGKELENKDGMDLAMCIIDWENSRIEFAGANISLMLLRRTSSNPHEMIEVRADRMPIGLFGNEIRPFTQHIIPITLGDSIYMYSDGYYDQFGGEELKKFKKKNLTKMLSEIHTLSMSEQKTIVTQTFDDWKGDLPQVDDVLMVGIKI
jgi:serine phosphatase RsbU (regulator of sigma subunit)